MNKAILIGRLTKEAELKQLSNGFSVATFTVAITRPYTNQEGEKESDFINCVSYGKQAENIAKYVGRGNLIGVDGRIQTRSYSAQDGTKRYVTEVICNNVVFLETKPKEKAYDDYSPYDFPNPRYNDIPNEEDEDLPF